MTPLHWILLLAWIVYYSVHSVLAATAVKEFLKKRLKKFFRYYRLSYSIFAGITLYFLLLFQYSFESPVLVSWVLLKYISLVILVLPGLTFMTISIKKYFLLLSGIRSLFESAPPVELKVKGIHRHVRHPLYLGTLLFVWGLFFIFPLLSNFIAVVLLTGYVLIGLGFEEKKLLKSFGKEYENYMAEVPKLWPGFKMNK